MDIPTGNGSVTGYAWGGNGYGWLSFNDADLTGCPSGACSAKRQTNALVGWARLLSIKNAGANSGGWNGWVQLDGVSIDPTSGNLSGYAWSDELGFIDFSGTPGSTPSLSLHYNNCAGVSVPNSIALVVNGTPSGTIVACEGTNQVTELTWAINPSTVATWGNVNDSDKKNIKGVSVGTATLSVKKATTGEFFNPNPITVTVSGGGGCISPDNGCAASTCSNTTCFNGCNDVPGTMVCNPKGFTEVTP